MCGRYQLSKSPAIWLAPLGVRDEMGGSWQPHYNITPSAEVPVVCETETGDLALRTMQWGFVPHWQQGAPRIRPINARAEEAADKPFWRQAYGQRRCLVPATGFYEWQDTGHDKNPYLVTIAGGRPFLMAGIWDTYHGEEEPQETFAILTTRANKAMQAIHPRMPVIVPAAVAGQWIHAPAADMTAPIAAHQVCLQPVARSINSPAFNQPPQPIEQDAKDQEP